MDNYIVINGQRIELTDEQLEKLSIKVGIKVGKKTPFTRTPDSLYWSINALNTLTVRQDDNQYFDNDVYNVANYFNDKDFAQQVAWHELLNRKLLKYAYDHNAADCNWYDENTTKYFIAKVPTQDAFRIECSWIWKNNSVYFNSTDVAEAAIKDIIRPFMEEHPEFVW